MNPYRHEIDGLRAIAVVSIILFHLKVPFFGGGFVGVDLFFVLSGYLITNNLVNDLATDRFSFSAFYVRRIARLLPALLVTILVTLLVSLYLYQPALLVENAKHSIAAAVSLSNVVFWQGLGYWTTRAESFPLLHTWSLGVEEQFYLFYPLLVVLCVKRLGQKWFGVTLLLLLVLSYMATASLAHRFGTAVFYLTPFRFYEFAVGGLCAVALGSSVLRVGNSLVRASIGIIGLALLCYSFVTFNRHTLLFNPHLIWLPLCGTLIFLALDTSARSRHWLAAPVMTWIGKISYSLYLVHWPIVTFYRHHYGERLSAIETCLLLVFIFAAGATLNKAVETRFRLGSAGSPLAKVTARKSLSMVACTLVAIFGVGVWSMVTQGWPQRYSDEEQRVLSLNTLNENRKVKRKFQELCIPQGEIFCGELKAHGRNILLLADSRGPDIYLALRAVYPDWGILASSAPGCAPVFSQEAGYSPYFPECPVFNQARLETALEAPGTDIVVLAMNLTKARTLAAQETVRRLVDSGKRVFLLGEFSLLARRTPQSLMVDGNRFEGFTERYDQFMVENPFSLDRDLAPAIEALGATYVRNEVFLRELTQRYVDEENDRLISLDGLHLNLQGAALYGRYLKQYYPLAQISQRVKVGPR